MEIVSLIIAILALFLSIMSFGYSIRKDKRNFVLNQLIEIKNNILIGCDALEKSNLYGFLSNQLKKITTENKQEILDDFLLYRPEISKSCSNIIMYSSMVKATPNSVALMQCCSKILIMFDNINQIIANQSEINEIIQKSTDLISAGIKDKTLININNLKLKVVLEINNLINDIIKSKIKSGDLLSTLTNAKVPEEEI